MLMPDNKAIYCEQLSTVF